jgi:hypothetical protein
VRSDKRLKKAEGAKQQRSNAVSRMRRPSVIAASNIQTLICKMEDAVVWSIV